MVADSVYLGINNEANLLDIQKIYIGINNLAKEVDFLYIGYNNEAATVYPVAYSFLKIGRANV